MQSFDDVRRQDRKQAALSRNPNPLKLEKKELQRRTASLRVFIDDFQKQKISIEQNNATKFAKNWHWRNWWDNLFKNNEEYNTKTEVLVGEKGAPNPVTSNRMTVHQRHRDNQRNLHDIGRKNYEECVRLYRQILQVKEKSDNDEKFAFDPSLPAHLMVMAMKLDHDVYWDGDVEDVAADIPGAIETRPDPYGRLERLQVKQRRTKPNPILQRAKKVNVKHLMGTISVSAFPPTAILVFETNPKKDLLTMFSLIDNPLGVSRNMKQSFAEFKRFVLINHSAMDEKKHGPAFQKLKDRRQKLRLLMNSELVVPHPTIIDARVTGKLLVKSKRWRRVKGKGLVPPEFKFKMIDVDWQENTACCSCLSSDQKDDSLLPVDLSEKELTQNIDLILLEHEYLIQQQIQKQEEEHNGKIDHYRRFNDRNSRLSYAFHTEIYLKGHDFGRDQLRKTLEETDGPENPVYQNLFGDNPIHKNQLEELYTQMEEVDQFTPAECYWTKIWIGLLRTYFHVYSPVSMFNTDVNQIESPFNWCRSTCIAYRPMSRDDLEDELANQTSFPLANRNFQLFFNMLYSRLHIMDPDSEFWKLPQIYVDRISKKKQFVAGDPLDKVEMLDDEKKNHDINMYKDEKDDEHENQNATETIVFDNDNSDDSDSEDDDVYVKPVLRVDTSDPQELLHDEDVKVHLDAADADDADELDDEEAARLRIQEMLGNDDSDTSSDFDSAAETDDDEFGLGDAEVAFDTNGLNTVPMESSDESDFDSRSGSDLDSLPDYSIIAQKKGQEEEEEEEGNGDPAELPQGAGAKKRRKGKAGGKYNRKRKKKQPPCRVNCGSASKDGGGCSLM